MSISRVSSRFIPNDDLSFRELERRVTVLLASQANSIRQRYIDRFVDTDSEHYQRYIATTEHFSDGEFYTGYLWDTLKRKVIVSEQAIPTMIGADQRVYVLWDLHSSDRILIPGYWRFPREAVLEIKYADMILGSIHLPEDLYVFAEHLDISVVLTHETQLDNSRICFEVR